MMGKPLHFDPDHYLDSVEQMIRADEIVSALWMLDNMPGYYRDNKPQRALDIKKKIYQQLMTVVDYASDGDETKEASEDFSKVPLEEYYRQPHCSPRGVITVGLVQSLNLDGYSANIVELGPANYWLPTALKSLNCDFTYEGYSINPLVKSPIETIKSDKPIKNIFVCFEVIEHLFSPDDIYHFYCKSKMDADYVLMSTPKYTLMGGLPDWDTRTLGHIRTYTPTEFVKFGTTHWHGLSWQIIDSDMMVLVGSKQQLDIRIKQ
jgi:hypothetical protein